MRRHNHELAVWAQQHLCDAWEVPPATPRDGSMIGSMATVAVPAAVRSRFEQPEQLQRLLYETHRIEVPVIDWDQRWWIRVSCHIYNRPGQYEALAAAVLQCDR